jgi:primosomal protein N'
MNEFKRLKKDNPQLHQTYLGLASLMAEFNLAFDEFSKTLREYYVFTVHQNCKTVSRTSLRCGIDRRLVSAIIKNEKNYSHSTTLSTIANEIEALTNTKAATINKYGKASIQNIMKKHASGATTVNSIVDELVDLGFIANQGQQVKRLKNWQQLSYHADLPALSEKLGIFIEALIQYHHRG